jgi:hypothetical protein
MSGGSYPNQSVLDASGYPCFDTNCQATTTSSGTSANYQEKRPAFVFPSPASPVIKFEKLKYGTRLITTNFFTFSSSATISINISATLIWVNKHPPRQPRQHRETEAEAAGNGATTQIHRQGRHHSMDTSHSTISTWPNVARSRPPPLALVMAKGFFRLPDQPWMLLRQAWPEDPH